MNQQTEVLPARSFLVSTASRSLMSATISTGEVHRENANVSFYVCPAPSSKKRKRQVGEEEGEEEDATSDREKLYVLSRADGDEGDEFRDNYSSYSRLNFLNTNAQAVMRFLHALVFWPKQE